MATIFGKIIRGIGDIVVGTADTTLSRVGLGSVIPDSAYSSTTSANAWTSVQKLGNVASNTALNAVAPGAGTITGALQNLNPKAATTSGSTVPTAPGTIMPAVTMQNNATPNEPDYTDYYIVGGVLLVLLILIIIFLMK
jgi:hypothetical protein